MTARLLVIVLVMVWLGACGRVSFDRTSSQQQDAASDSNEIDAGPRGCVAQVAAGREHTCVLLLDGSLRCVGANGYGELGTGTATSAQPTPIAASTLTAGATTLEVATGRNTTCVRRSNDSLACVGDNDNRQLDGVSTITSSPAPLSPGPTPLSATVFGGGFACALTTGNVVVCWGDADEGQSGLGSNPNFHMPEAITSLGGVDMLAAGGDHMCVTKGGDAWCWGDGRLTRLGSAPPGSCVGASAGTIPCAQTPMMVLPAAGVLRTLIGVAVGNTFAVAWSSSGAAVCWGGNASGECARVQSVQESPAMIASLTGVQQMAAGRDHACALVTDGSVWCWGDGASGQLGPGATASIDPVQVPLAGPARSLSAHALGSYTCALLANDDVWCWGANASGQLGRGTITPLEPPGPVMIDC